MAELGNSYGGYGEVRGFGGGGVATRSPGGVMKPVAPPPVDYSAILKQFGNSAPAPAQPMTNTSTPNPGIGWANEKLKGLYEGGGNVDALGRQTAGQIRDDAESLRKGARDSATARGVSGGGVESLANSSIDRSVLQNQAKARVGIANDWEARKQGVLQDYAGNSATDENLQNTQRNTALNQQQLQYQQQQGAQSHKLQMLSTVLNLFGAPTFA